MPSIQGNVGLQNQADGAFVTARYGKQGEQIVTQLHGRFYEQALRGNVFGNGTLALTALSANTISLSATTTPILGVYNPLGSGVNAVILQAQLAAGANNTNTVGAGIFVWATSTGNTAVSTGAVPFAHLIGGAASKCKGLAFVALTGITTNLVAQLAADFSTPTIITTATMPATVQTPTVSITQNLEGAIIVPPGGVLALLNTVSTTTVSVHGRLMWEEVPIS